MKPKVARAIVIGGSIGGLFAGLALHRSGWQVDIFESTTALDGRGAGIVTHQALFDVMQSLGFSDTEGIGLPIDTRKIFAPDGAVLASMRVPQTVTSWGRLHRVLRAAFPDSHYHHGMALRQIESRADEVRCHFADGSSHSAPMVVAADGIRSTVRAQLEPEAIPAYATYVAWRGLVDESHFNVPLLKELFPLFSFCLPPGEQMLAYPVAGENFVTTPGKRRCNAVWYRQADAEIALPELLTDINGNNNGMSIAPNKVRPQVIEQMQAEAASHLSPQHAAIVQKMHQPFIQPIYDVVSESMVHGRVVLVGDAAFTARPHLGMGVTKAAEDAQALADCLHRNADVPIALQRFKSIRQPVNEFIVERSRQMGSALQAALAGSEQSALYGSVESVIRETASYASVAAFVKARESG